MWTGPHASLLPCGQWAWEQMPCVMQTSGLSSAQSIRSVTVRGEVCSAVHTCSLTRCESIQLLAVPLVHTGGRGVHMSPPWLAVSPASRIQHLQLLRDTVPSPVPPAALLSIGGHGAAWPHVLLVRYPTGEAFLDQPQVLILLLSAGWPWAHFLPSLCFSSLIHDLRKVPTSRG